MVNRANFITGVGGLQANTKPAAPSVPGRKGDFAATLAQESLKISAHAQKRLNSSQVQLTPADMRRLDGAVEKASEKGANQSLIMLDNLALVVSVKNKVVITAVDEARSKEGVFTNIDSVVIA